MASTSEHRPSLEFEASNLWSTSRGLFEARERCDVETARLAAAEIEAIAVHAAHPSIQQRAARLPASVCR